jgi:hypothetical protein
MSRIRVPQHHGRIRSKNREADRRTERHRRRLRGQCGQLEALDQGDIGTFIRLYEEKGNPFRSEMNLKGFQELYTRIEYSEICKSRSENRVTAHSMVIYYKEKAMWICKRQRGPWLRMESRADYHIGGWGTMVSDLWERFQEDQRKLRRAMRKANEARLECGVPYLRDWDALWDDFRSTIGTIFRTTFGRPP